MTETPQPAPAVWMPIESAPKTLHHILVWTPENKCCSLVVWGPEDIRDGEGWRHAFGDRKLIDTPSHWMPLPEPPT